MLRITKQTDYGIMFLVRMASLPQGQVLSARDAAEWAGLSIPMASKILKRLARGSIVNSHRGVGGGYSLAGPAERTTLAAVIRALEGPISIVECGAEPGQCDQEPNCPVRVNWARVSREVERALERVPVTDMVTSRSLDLLTLGEDRRKRHPKPGTS